MTVDGLEHGQRSSPGNVLQFLVSRKAQNKIEADFLGGVERNKSPLGVPFPT